jgi:uncharacterized repeat protein (TIGR01451 family)
MQPQSHRRRGALALSAFILIALIGLAGALVSSEVAAQLPGQNDEALCSPFVEDALTAVGANCDGLNRNTACYGYNNVGASFAQTVPVRFFTQPSERGDLPVFRRIETSALNLDQNQWGIALLSVQADLPRTLPGQSVLFMLVGDSEVENAVRRANTFTSTTLVPVTTRMPANLYAAPALDARILGSVPMRTTLDADATTRDGAWARVTFEGRPGWLARTVLDVPTAPALPVYDGNARTPMQAFYFRTGIGALNCIPAPSTLIVQGPQNLSVNLTANGANIQLGSTINMNTLPVDPATVAALFPTYRGRERIAGLLQVITLDGEAIIDAESENPIRIPVGKVGITCLGAARNLGTDGVANDNRVIPECGWIIRDLTLGDLAPLTGIEGFTLNYPITLPPIGNPPPIAPTNDPGESTSVPPTLTPTATLPPPPASANLSLIKSPDGQTPTTGATIPFSILVENAGPNVATNVVVNDLLPAGLSYVSHAVTQGTYNPGTGVWNVGGIAQDGDATLTINALVSAGVGTSIVNTAAITSLTETDPDTTNNSDSADVTVVPPGCTGIPNPVMTSAELIAAIDAANNETLCPGGNTINLRSEFVYIFNAVNNALNGANALPAIITPITINGNGSTLTRTGTANFRLFVVPAGGTLALLDMVLINGSSLNSGGAILIDGGTLTANTVTFDANAAASGGGLAITAGSVTLADSIFDGNSASLTVGGALANSGGTLTLNRVTVNNNTASVSGGGISVTGGNTTLANSTISNNTTSAGSAGGIDASAALNLINVTLSGNTATSTTSALSVSGGNTNASFVTITDHAAHPAVNAVGGGILTFKNSIVGGNPGGNCGSVVQTLGGNYSDDATCAGFTVGTLGLGVLDDNGGTTLTHAISNVSAPYNGAADCLAIGGALVTTDQRGLGRPFGGQCDAGAFEAQVAPPLSDVAIIKTVDDPNPSVGDTVVYTITAQTLGPNPATNVVINDLLALGVTYVTHTTSSGTYNPGTGDWAIPAMNVGTLYTLTLTATVNALPPGSVVINTAALVSLAESDTTIGNNIAAITFTVSQADLEVNKSANTTTPNEGASVTFTISVTNNGGQPATAVIVRDLIPAGLTYLSHATVTGAYNPISGDWNVGNMTVGQTSVLQIDAQVNVGTGGTTIDNTASILSSGTADPIAANNSDTVTLNIPIPNIDLGVTKIVDDATPIQGQTITFTITASNNSAPSATGVTVNDPLPGGLSFLSASPSTGTYNSGTGVWTIGALNNLSSATLTIQATVTAAAATPITNTATISGAQPDPNGANNSADANLTVATATGDLSVTKVVDNPTPAEGDMVVFTVTIEHIIGDNIPNVIINDLLPLGVTYVSHSAGLGTYTPGTGIWDVDTIEDDESGDLQITATVNAGTASTTITNTATIDTSNYNDTNAPNNSAGAAINVVSSCGSIANPITTVTELISGITTANDEGCFPGQDTLNLQSATTFTLTAVNNSSVGDNGLPQITSNIVIAGNGSTIERSGAAPNFRLFQVNGGGVLTLNDLTLQGGSAAGFRGGAIHNLGMLTLNSSIVQNNSAFSGGGLFNSLGTVNISFSVISSNTATGGSGGGIDDLGTLSIDHSTIRNNTSVLGGGIYSDASGSLTINTSTISGNSSSTTGGGLRTDGSMTMINVTISGNAGGGIQSNSANVDISFTTITANTGGAGLLGASSPANIKNSIVALNPGGDCSGSVNVVAATYSVIPSCAGLTIVGEINLGPLQNNGGTTQTHSIDSAPGVFEGAADCNAVGGASIGTDQRGTVRPQASLCDAGAYEFQP